MGFSPKQFNSPIYIAEDKEPARVIIISCEGRNTEPEYFEAIKDIHSEYISDLLEINIVPKFDNNSEPQHVLNNLEEHIKNTYDYKSNHDEMWIVLDREKVEDRKQNILNIIPTCTEKNYQIVLSNPTFEFWLLLHVVDIKEYDNDDLFENKKISKKRRFIDKELSSILEGGYGKKKGNFNKRIVLKDNIIRAIAQEKSFENNLEEIIDNLGSNVGVMIEKILNFND